MSSIFDGRPDDEVAGLRVPPHSVEAEHSVLGGLLIDNVAWDKVADLLREDDFYRHEHRTIFIALGRLINAGKPADVVTVFDALGDKGAEVGGLAYLNALAQSVPSAANVRRYAEIVRERSILRQVIAKLDEAGSIVYGEGDVATKVDQIGALFAGIDERNASRQPQGMDAIMVRVIDGINAAAEGKSEAWKTGIPGLDARLLGGLKPGKLVICAARPGVGKTSLAMQILKRVAEAGYPTLMLSQEMENDELGRRSLSSESLVDYGNIQTGQLSTEEWTRISQGLDELARLPMWCDDEPGLKLHAINTKARRVKGLKVLVVDYAQLCEGEGETRSAQVGSISRGLKKLAKQLGCCVILISQLNRSVETRPGKRPQLSDLRDSGEIEQDADVIWLLWQLADEVDGLVRVGLDLAKNRQGRRGAMVLEFNGATQKWFESSATLAEALPAKGKKAFE